MKIRSLGAGVASILLALAVAPPAALAHGIQGRAETPIPIAAFFVAGGGVLVVSFLALAFGWAKPKLAGSYWRAGPEWLNRLALSPVLLWIARGWVLAWLFFLFAAAAFGSTELADNIAPVTIFVVWWVGLVPLSVLFGPVWRAVNPWNTLAILARVPAKTEREAPPWLGLWPAALYLTAFGWFELAYPTASEPRLLAGLILAYSVLTLAGMARFGREAWLDRGEVFSVYTSTLATLAPVEVRDTPQGRRLGFRPPVIGAVTIRWEPAQVVFIAVLIGTVTFDGLSSSDFWEMRDLAAAERLINLGVSSFSAGVIVATLGLGLTLLLLIGLYEFAAWISGRLGGWSSSERGRNAIAFVHSLIPIALAYFVAHYFTLFVFQSQDLIRLISDPFGTGADIFRTSDFAINFELVSPNLIWAVQVGAIVLGHIAGLMLAHDRALELAKTPGAALRSQYPMLALMVLLTISGLWSLSQGMAGG